MKYLNFDNLISSPLYELAITKLIVERKITTKQKGQQIHCKILNPQSSFLDTLMKMLEIVDVAHKQGQLKKLNNYIKGVYR